MDSEQHWKLFKAVDIPTKQTLHTSFTDAIRGTKVVQAGNVDPCRILDMGCGDGRIAVELEEGEAHHGVQLQIFGVDCNQEAIEVANKRASDSPIKGGSKACFTVGQVSSLDLRAEQAPFDVVLCQLVISVVGGKESRVGLLRACQRHLKPGGVLLLSTSGASEGVNEAYRELYERDRDATGEWRTYYSRDKEGQVLYETHHFEKGELHSLLNEAGFVDIVTKEEEEASSRRPDQKAVFLYTVARKPWEAAHTARTV